jgi:kynurenine formamidase
MRIVDLSYQIYPGMFRFLGDYHPEVKVEVTGTYERDRCEVRRLTIGTHSGTHVDAPAHFIPGGQTIEQVPLDVLFARTQMIDAWTEVEGTVLPGALFDDADFARVGGVLIRTGWERRWGDAAFYRGFPALAGGVIQRLMARGCKHLAVDFPLTTEVHQVALGGGAVLMENLCNVAAITERRPLLSALALRLRGGDASPTRVVAIEGWPEEG